MLPKTKATFVFHRSAKVVLPVMLMIIQFLSQQAGAQDYQQPGSPARPTYEAFRVDNLASQTDVNPAGDLSFSIPLLIVPNRLGHDWQIKLDYYSNVSQRQRASWVGLGWNLDLGSVERTIMGRSDDQNHGLPNGELGSNAGLENEAPENWGRLWDYHTQSASSSVADSFDQADVYRLSINGSSTEILPFPTTTPSFTDDSMLVSATCFLPIQYKPWTISAAGWPNGSEQIQRFWVRKEDGTQYLFGNYYTTGVERIKVETLPGETPAQNFTYPYRWNLVKVIYPDGVTTSIEHTYQNQLPSTAFRHTWDQVQIHRNRFYPDFPNTFGKRDNEPLQDGYVNYEYSRPTKLETETHYAMFYSTILGDESTERNSRLDSIKLFDRKANTLLRRVVFSYATGSNTNGNSSGIWETGKKLSNNQQTLCEVQIYGGDGTAQPPYKFEYLTNPSTNPQYLTTYSLSEPQFPGYLSDLDGDGIADTLALAWKLKKLQLPTGGTIEWTYERIGFVGYDPEGNSNYGLHHWGYKMQPRGRVKTKAVTNELGEARLWTFSYGPALFDWPSRVNSSTYVPSIYRTRLFQDYTSNNYYQMFRGCPVSHRWVSLTNPDGSTRRVHFTSSYCASDALTEESQPDILSNYWDQNEWYVTKVWSRAGRRGLIWKEVLNDADSSRFVYSFRELGGMLDRYEYYPYYGPGARVHYVYNTSVWAAQDSVIAIRDGVLSKQYILHCLSPREASSGNASIRSVTNYGTHFDRKTVYEYAGEKYPEMANRGMLTQPFSEMVEGGATGVTEKKWTTWKALSSPDVYVPGAEWVSSTGTDSIRVVDYTSYDSWANVTLSTDANGLTTSYTYGSYGTPSGSQPYENAYLRRAERTLGSTVLGQSFEYTALGKVSKITDENAQTVRFQYDGLGRLKELRGPDSSLVSDYSYYYFSEDNPNYIRARNFRTASDFIQTNYYADNLGQPYQTQVGLGSGVIVTQTDYDSLWRPRKVFKPYLFETGFVLDEQVQFHDSAYYHSLGISTGSRPFTSYIYDKSGRVVESHSPGNVFDTAFVKTRFGYNSPADSTGYPPGTLLKTITVDENKMVSEEYRDLLGNVVLTRTDSAGSRLTTRFIYDALGKTKHVVRPGGSLSSYSYDGRGLLTVKTTPEGGSVQTLYDKAGNVRLVKDGAHSGTTTNAVSITPVGNVIAPYYASGQFVLGMPGRVTLTTIVYDIGEPETDYITIYIKANNTVLLQTSSSGWSGSSASILLPKGTFSYEVQTHGDYGGYNYSITANTGFEFIYRKYDALSRLVELGEYESNSLSGNFTRANAENVAFPTSNRILAAAMYYDTASTDQLVAGLQHNLLGRLSTSKTCRFGQPVLTTFYSYDTYGRVEWMAQSGEATGSAARKIAYEYDLQGSIRKKTFTDYFRPVNSLCVWYDYDGAGRLSRVYSGSDSLSRVRDVEYVYYANGRVDTVRYAEAQIIDHSYNERDWLTSLYSTRFEEKLGYNELSEIGALQPVKSQFNGNVSWLTNRTDGVSFGSGSEAASWVGYAFAYDGANRLRSGNFGAKRDQGGTWYQTSAYDMDTATYDREGNLDSLARHSSEGNAMDRLTYHYPTVVDNGMDTLLTVATDFVDEGWTPSDIHIPLRLANVGDWATIRNNNFNAGEIKKFRVALSAPLFTPLSNDTLRVLVFTAVSKTDDGGGEEKKASLEKKPIVPLKPWDPDSTSVTVTVKLLEENAGQLVERGSWNHVIWSNYGTYTLEDKIPLSNLTNPNGLYVEYRVSGWSPEVLDVYVDCVTAHVPTTNAYRPGTLSYITDEVSGSISSTDVDNQPTNNYAYDGNGNVQQDLGNGVAFILYGIDNLPLTLYKTSGSVVSYWYDHSGQRVRKTDGNTTVHYILDAGGQPFVVIDPAAPTSPTYYVHGIDLAGQVRRDSLALTRYGYLKDHLGSIRAIVSGGVSVVSDDFSVDLSKWTTTAGSGYSIENGELSASSGGQNILVNASSKTLSNGIVTAEVKAVGAATDDPCVVVRYSDVNNFYFVRPYGSTLQIWERINGSYYNRISASLGSSIVQGQWYKLKIVLSGSTLSAYWNGSGSPTVQWTNATRLSGKVGFLQASPRHVHWDNIVVVDTAGVGQLMASDDYDPWGLILEGRSTNQAMSGARFKFTGKERDVESQYDYFGARYYDSRIGRWLAADPLAPKYPGWSPFVFVLDNPLKFVDMHGDTSSPSQRQWWQIASDPLFGSPLKDRISQVFNGVKDLFQDILGVENGNVRQPKTLDQEDAERASNPASVTKEEVARYSFKAVEEQVGKQAIGGLASLAGVSGLAGVVAPLTSGTGIALSLTSGVASFGQDLMQHAHTGKPDYENTLLSANMAMVSHFGPDFIRRPAAIVSTAYTLSPQLQNLWKSVLSRK